MSIEALQNWREPLAADWHQRATALLGILNSAEPDFDFASKELRRLGGMRLGDSENLKLQRIVKVARKHGDRLFGFRQFRILMVSNRTLSFLASSLITAGIARALLIDVVEAAYDSAAALALNPAFQPPSGHFDAVFLLLDDSYFSSNPQIGDQAEEAVNFESLNEECAALVSGIRNKVKAPIIFSTIPISVNSQFSFSDLAISGSPRRQNLKINEIISQLATRSEVVLFDLNLIAGRVGADAFFDPVRYYQAKVPFAVSASPIIADGLAAVLSAMSGRSARALVLDLDNTLWGGVVADDGLESIVLGAGSPLGEAFIAIQSYVLELRRRGIVLAVCSKNLEKTARQPFREHPEMLISEEHITVFIANFDDKASNVASIARSLDLDPATLVFLDDNPAERERVRSELPFVMVPEVGDDAACFVRELVYSGYFEQMPLNKDDFMRAASYAARDQAKMLKIAVGDYDKYLNSLEMEMYVSNFDFINKSRITQLIQKSNQFNLTTKRYSEVDIVSFINNPEYLGWQVRLKDRFADHGIISCVIIKKSSSAWEIDTWVMSCRVLERGVEEAVMHEIVRLARACGVTSLVGVYKPTPRNVLVEKFFQNLGFISYSQTHDGIQTYHLDIKEEKTMKTNMRIFNS